MGDEPVVTNIDDALAQMGVTSETLTPEEKRSLDENGYVIFPNLIDAAWLEGGKAIVFTRSANSDDQPMQLFIVVRPLSSSVIALTQPLGWWMPMLPDGVTPLASQPA